MPTAANIRTVFYIFRNRSPDHLVISPNGMMVTGRGHQHYRQVSPTSSYVSERFSYSHDPSVPALHYDMYDPYGQNHMPAHISGHYYGPANTHTLSSAGWDGFLQQPSACRMSYTPHQYQPRIIQHPRLPTAVPTTCVMPAPTLCQPYNFYGNGQVLQRSPPSHLQRSACKFTEVPQQATRAIMHCEYTHQQGGTAVNLATGLETVHKSMASELTSGSTHQCVHGSESDSGVGSDISSGECNNLQIPTKQNSSSNINTTPRSSILTIDDKLHGGLARCRDIPSYSDFTVAELRNPIPEMDSKRQSIISSSDTSLILSPVRPPLTSTPCFAETVEIVKAPSGHRTKRLSKKSERYLGQNATKVLCQWYDNNVQFPYPSQKQKIILAKTCNLSLRQVTSWFNNKRNRSNNTKQQKSNGKLEHRLARLITNLVQNCQDATNGQQPLSYDNVKQQLQLAVSDDMDQNLSSSSSQLVVD